MSELKSIEPSKTLELYLKQKADDAADSTVKSHRYRLQHFIRWCDEEGIDNLNDQDWIQYNRPDREDEYGREPLLATEQGRIHKNNIRNIVYDVTRPCFVGNECCCDEEFGYNHPYQCCESVSPHSIRRDSITHHLKQEGQALVISDRANVSQDVLHKHYDRMTKREKMEQWRDCFEGI